MNLFFIISRHGNTCCMKYDFAFGQAQTNMILFINSHFVFSSIFHVMFMHLAVIVFSQTGSGRIPMAY